jgi:hypothetical protein
MTKKEIELLKLEIVELTELFYNEWDDLRDALSNAGVKINNGRLVAMYEDENDNMDGIFITENNQIVKYEILNNIAYVKIISNVDEVSEDYPQVIVAIQS